MELTKSYYATYTGSASGIGPEVFAWAPADGNATVPDDQREQFDKAGFWPTASSYLLRPETLESVYYAYRVTGDTRFQDDAWKAFERIEDLCRAGVGYSGLGDVSDPRGGKQDDFQQSFWTAETLKYLYLIFAPESAVQIRSDGKMDFVFNTEAHPFRVRP